MSRSYFPIGVWGAYAQDPANLDKDKAAGVNLYVWPADTSYSLQSFAANGMKALLTEDWYSVPGMGTAPANAGYVLGDEVDMTLGPGAGYTEMQNRVNRAPHDGRLKYMGYGKGVLFWETDQEAQQFVNNYEDIVAADAYWFTDPDVHDQSQGGEFLGVHRDLTSSETRRASNYGRTIDRLRYLDGLDGVHKPVWGIVELGWPFTETAAQGGRTIAPAEMRAATWQSIIAGARGINYFNHSFGGPCKTHHIDREPTCYTAIQAELTKLNSQIRQLAPMLNSPTVSSGWSQRRGTTALVKWVKAKKQSCKSNRKKCKKAKKKKAAGANEKRCNANKKKGCRKVVTGKGNLFLFAGSAGSSVNGRFTLPCVGRTDATAVGENRTVPVRHGTFRDRFANGNAIHIYRVPLGPMCASPRQATVIPAELPRGGGGGGGDPAPSSSNYLFRVVIAAMAVSLLGLAATYGRRRMPGRELRRPQGSVRSEVTASVPGDPRPSRRGDRRSSRPR